MVALDLLLEETWGSFLTAGADVLFMVINRRFSGSTKDPVSLNPDAGLAIIGQELDSRVETAFASRASQDIDCHPRPL